MGHSQGGDLAIRSAIKHDAQRVIVFCADISEKFPLPDNIIKNFAIDWIESGKDDVLSPERKASYKILQSMGMTVNHIICPSATHDNLDIEPYLCYIDNNAKQKIKHNENTRHR